MRKKVWKVTGLTAALALCLFAGYFWGTYSGKAKETSEVTEPVQAMEEKKAAQTGETTAGETVEAAQTEEISTYSGTIAIVNLDDGIMGDGQLMNYGVMLSETIQKTTKVTGLEDARNGIQTGAYNAYFIIPKTFSANVASVNEQPVKSDISYGVAPGLSGQEREDTLYAIWDIYDSFSNQLSQMYTASVLAEFHEVQDDAQGMLDRDKADLDKLLAVSGNDLEATIVLPSIERVAREVTELDLSKNYEANQEGVANVGSAYNAYVAKGQGDVEVIKDSSQTLQEKASQTKSKLDAVEQELAGTTLTVPDDTARSGREDASYQSHKDAIVGSGGLLESHNGSLGDFNYAVALQSEKYDYLESQYRLLAGELSGCVTGGSSVDVASAVDPATTFGVTESTYSLYSPAQAAAIRSTLQAEIERLDTELATYKGSSVVPPALTMDGYVDSLLAADGLLEGAGQLKADVVFTAGLPVDEVLAPEVTIDGAACTQMPGVDVSQAEAEVDAIINEARTGRSARNQELADQASAAQTKTETLKTQVGEVSSAYTEQSGQQSSLHSALTGLNLSSYIDQDEVENLLTSMNRNLGTIEGKVSESNRSYQSYAGKVYSAYTKNSSAMQQSIREGQEASNRKLESGLSEAKASREASNAANTASLEELITRLPYSRIGTLENQQVYQFMASPLSLDNQSQQLTELPRKVSGTGAGVGSQGGASQGRDAESWIHQVPIWLWTLLAALVVLVLVITGVVRGRAGRGKEQF